MHTPGGFEKMRDDQDVCTVSVPARTGEVVGVDVDPVEDLTEDIAAQLATLAGDMSDVFGVPVSVADLERWAATVG